jgi:hypothetical protein
MVAHAVSLLTFPHALGVRGEVYSTAWPLSVEGAEVAVRLPRFNIDSPSTRDHWPTSPEVPNAEKLSEWLADDEGRVQWGSTYQYGKGPEMSSVVGDIKHAALVVQFPDETTDKDERLAVTKRASAVAEDWCRRVDAWLSARSRLRIDPGYTGMVGGNQNEYAGGSWLHQTTETPSGWDWLHASGHQVVVFQVPSTWPDLGYDMFASRLEDWEQASQAASTRFDIPAEWQLFDSAFSACLDGSFRVAVLDAATALELVLTALIHSHLAPNNTPETVEAIEKRVGTLGPMLDFARDLGFSLSPALRDGVVRLRNRVAHADYRAGREETAEALSLVREVLNQHAPLPVL